MPGYPELDGCPYPDRDKDGVTDNKDRCPDEPGSTKNDGCPVTDRDGDGVPDATDRCPDTPGPASNYGCPEDVKTKLTISLKTFISILIKPHFRKYLTNLWINLQIS